MIAINNKNQSDWSKVELKMAKGNMNAPRIMPSSCGNISIYENISTNQLIHVFAIDYDEDENGIIEFKIIGWLFIYSVALRMKAIIIWRIIGLLISAVKPTKPEILPVKTRRK